jgi:hypothetical protein
MSFPSTPTNGQTATVNGIAYVYNSTTNAWTRQLTQTGEKTTTSTTPPVNPGPGDAWYNPTNDVILTYMYDGLNYYWIDRDGPNFGSGNYVYGNLNLSGNIVPTANVTYNLGSPTQRFASLYLSGNTIDLGGAVIKSDATTGAIALIPTPTTANPNPTGMVLSPTGAVSTVATTGGVVSAGAIATSSNATATTGTTLANLTVTGNAVIQGNLQVTGNVITVNYETVLYTETANVITANSFIGNVVGILTGNVNTQYINAGINNTLLFTANGNSTLSLLGNGLVNLTGGLSAGNTTIGTSGGITIGVNNGLSIASNSDLYLYRADGYGTFSIVTPAGQNIEFQKVSGGAFGNFTVNSSNGISLANSGTSVVTNPGSLPGSTSIGYMITQTGGESLGTEPLSYSNATLSTISIPPGVWVIRAVAQIIDATGSFNATAMAMAITTNASYAFPGATNSGFQPDHNVMYGSGGAINTLSYRGRVHNSRVISNTTGSNVNYYIILSTNGSGGGTYGMKTYVEAVKVY